MHYNTHIPIKGGEDNENFYCFMVVKYGATSRSSFNIFIDVPLENADKKLLGLVLAGLSLGILVFDFAWIIIRGMIER